MTFDRMSTLMTWGGKIGSNTQEIWQCGLHFALDPQLDGPGLPTFTAAQAFADGALATFHSAAAMAVSMHCSLEWLKFAQLDNQGRYTADPLECAVFPIVYGGSQQSHYGAPQDALCVTLSSGQVIGQANYGRFYVPWNELQINAGGRMDTGQVNNALSAILPFLNSCNTFAGANMSATARISIMSKIATGTTKRATQVRLGDVKDTQRRRRNRLHETYAQQILT